MSKIYLKTFINYTTCNRVQLCKTSTILQAGTLIVWRHGSRSPGRSLWGFIVVHSKRISNCLLVGMFSYKPLYVINLNCPINNSSFEFVFKGSFTGVFLVRMMCCLPKCLISIKSNPLVKKSIKNNNLLYTHVLKWNNIIKIKLWTRRLKFVILFTDDMVIKIIRRCCHTNYLN